MKVKRFPAVDLGLVIIDYIQIMDVDDTAFEQETRATRFAAIARSLKGMSEELGVHIIELAQPNKAIEVRAKKAGQRYRVNDIRESSAIGHNADTVCFMHPINSNGDFSDDSVAETGAALWYIVKNRRGITPEMKLKFDKKRCLFTPAAF